MDYKLEDLIDISLLQDLQEKLNVIYTFPSAIIDIDGKILTAVAWQDICTKFHRKHPECEKECIKSDQYIYEHLHEANPAISYQCPHGLVDNATPIIINEKHLGNFFTGQFFLKPPDKEFFRLQAKKYGFDETAYLEAVDKVPVWTKEKLHLYLDFIKGFIEIIAGIGLKNLKEKEINLKLQDKENQHKTILKTAMDGFVVIDINGQIKEVNGTYCRMNGYSEVELLRMYINDLEAEETPDITFAHFQKIIQIGEDRFETRHRRKDGSIYDVEISVQYQPFNGGRFVAFARDITQIKKSKQELKESKEKYLKIFDRAPVLISITDFETGTYQEVNKFALSFSGFSNEDVIGHKSTEIGWISPENRYLLIKTLIEKGKIEGLEIPFNTKEGNVVYGLVNGEKITMGNKECLLTITADITLLKEAENELKAAKEKAEESDRLKTAFLQNMSHEIRTPMNAIMGFSELLEKNFNDKIKLHDFTQIINQRCNDLLVIIDDILDISKIESGQLSVVNEKCDITELLAELKLLFVEQQNRMNKHHIDLVLQPRCDQSMLIIETDKVKLKQIFINLIGNALKFTDYGKIEGGCYIENQGEMTFFVSDTGIGIPLDKQQTIFERFIQIEPSPKRLYGGTGLGLSIVKGLLDLMGGKVWLTSEPGKGSTFYFTLPYKFSDVLEKETMLPVIDVLENFIEDKTILVVEDDIFSASFLEEILSDLKLKVIVAHFGNEAIDIAAHIPVDLIMMDIGLPDINGYEVTRRIKQLKPGVKIIARTAYAAGEDRQKALDAGCIDYISKPLRFNQLITLVKKYL